MSINYKFVSGSLAVACVALVATLASNQAAQARGQAAAPAANTFHQRIDHSVVNWGRLELARNPSSMTIAAYDGAAAE